MMQNDCNNNESYMKIKWIIQLKIMDYTSNLEITFIKSWLVHLLPNLRPQK